MNINYCPLCGYAVYPNKEGFLSCQGGCGKYVHYDNPVPVVACLIPFPPSAAPSARSQQPDGVVLVQRNIEPFKGEWCLPCGFINHGETPKYAAAREALEETGLVVRCEKILSACAPSMSEKDDRLNFLVVFYMARQVDGLLKAGDDAQDARVFKQGDLPPICFRSHRMIVDKYFEGAWGSLTGVDL